jgi:hypothetical protein
LPDQSIGGTLERDLTSDEIGVPRADRSMLCIPAGTGARVFASYLLISSVS